VSFEAYGFSSRGGASGADPGTEHDAIAAFEALPNRAAAIVFGLVLDVVKIPVFTPLRIS
jgi:hypothetical protein